MNWFIFAFGSAIFLAVSRIFTKKSLMKTHAIENTAIDRMIQLLILCLLFFWIDFSIELWLLAIIFVISFLVTVGNIYLMKGYRHCDISMVDPMTNLSPAIVLLLAVLFLGEQVSLVQIIGIFLLVVGTYVLEVDHSISNLKEPFIKLWKSKYTHYILFALLLFGLTAVGEKFVLSYTKPFTIIFYVHLFIAIISFIFLTIFHDGIKDIKHGLNTAGFIIILGSFFKIISSIFYYFAASLQSISLVIPIKRLSTFFTTLIGGKMFHEEGLPLKVIACLIMILGVVFVTIY